jgi:hypothetical protein
MWLTGRRVPDHKTIADFRKDNGLAIRQVCSPRRLSGYTARASRGEDEGLLATPRALADLPKVINLTEALKAASHRTQSRSQRRRQSISRAEIVRFAADSLLEGTGFEPSVPLL